MRSIHWSLSNKSGLPSRDPHGLQPGAAQFHPAYAQGPASRAETAGPLGIITAMSDDKFTPANKTMSRPSLSTYTMTSNYLVLQAAMQ